METSEEAAGEEVWAVVDAEGETEAGARDAAGSGETEAGVGAEVGAEDSAHVEEEGGERPQELPDTLSLSPPPPGPDAPEAPEAAAPASEAAMDEAEVASSALMYDVSSPEAAELLEEEEWEGIDGPLKVVPEIPEIPGVLGEDDSDFLYAGPSSLLGPSSSEDLRAGESEMTDGLAEAQRQYSDEHTEETTDGLLGALGSAIEDGGLGGLPKAKATSTLDVLEGSLARDAVAEPGADMDADGNGQPAGDDAFPPHIPDVEEERAVFGGRRSLEGSLLSRIAESHHMNEQPRQAVASAKLLAPPPVGKQVSARAAESAVSEGRGSVASHLETGSEKAAKSSQPQRRKGKKNVRNIFLEFGMDSDAAAMTEVEIGGVIVKRVNIKRFWQSDNDLHRWRQGLHDNTRFNKLQILERARFHEDFRADRAELRANHNGFRRQKTAPIVQPKVPQATELRDLRISLEPKELKGKAKHTASLKELFALKREADPVGQAAAVASGSDAGDVGFLLPGEEPASTLERSTTTEALRRFSEVVASRYGSLEAAWSSLDMQGIGVVALTEVMHLCAETGHRHDGATIVRLMDRSHGSITREEFMRLRPHLLGGLAYSPLTSGRRSRSEGQLESLMGGSVQSGSRLSSQASQQKQLPRSAALLIFRNGERPHKGEPVLFKRWPPASMAELLKVCSDSCRPLIMPAMRLLDENLTVIKSPGDVQPGKHYLLKGTESLDPPPLFYHHKARAPVSGSFRHLERVRHSAVAEQEQPPLSPKHLSFQSISQASSSPIGSPPWLSQEKAVPLQLGLKWQDERGVSSQLSWGGQGPATTHHHFHTWQSVLPPGRRDQRRSASSSVY